MSEKRQRTEVVAVRLLPAEKDLIDQGAALTKVPAATFMRATALICARAVSGSDGRGEGSQ